MEKRMAGDYEIIHAFHIGDKEIVIGENVNAPGDERYMCAYCEKNEILGLYSDLWVSDDFCEIAKIYADRLSEQAEKTRRALFTPKFQGIDTTPMTKADCTPISSDDNLNGKIVVIKQDVLRQEYRRSTNQIKLCTGGFGASAKPKREYITFESLYPDIPKEQRNNFRITDPDLGHGSAGQKYAANVAAIRMLKRIEDEGRLATPVEQEILSRYVGWGGLADCFDEKHHKYPELKALLSEEEFADARASSLTAFYTSPVIIQVMYQALEQMGFKEGNILEPSCGVGNFLGMIPDSMAGSKTYGVELDSISGRIAQQLYQNSSIAVTGFEKVQMPDSFFDVAIGNVPFGDFKVLDKRYDKHHWLIHDYFFGKTLDKVRPGGIVAFITSKGTMDKENSAVRKYLAQRADLIGAIRLPNDAFKRNAGTEVTSDILFLQKRDRMTDIEPDWVHLDTDPNGIRMNSYFVQHPEMILGEMVMESTRFGMDSTCKPYPEKELGWQLAEAVSTLNAQITEYQHEELEEDDRSIPADPNVRNFSYTIVDGKIYFRENSRMNPVDVSVTAENRIRGMIHLRDCVRKLIDYQTEGYPDEDIQREQRNLSDLYDDYTKKYGLLCSRGNSLAFSDDSSYFLLCSLEVLDEEGNFKRKADMFTKRTIRPHVAVTTVDTASEALALLVAPFVSGGLMEIVTQFPAAMDNPFHIELCEDSKKTVLIFMLIYVMGIGIALSSRRNYRRGEEHGSAKWGSASAVNKKYQDKNPEANKVFTKQVRMGLDGRKHRRNLNTCVVGGSGSGKSRFYALINLLQACTSYFVLDCKGELLRMTGTFLKMRGYEIKVLDLLSMDRSHCFNPFAYLHTDNDVQKLVTNLFKATTPKGSQSQDPFWDTAASMLLSAIIFYLLYEAPEEEQNFPMVMEMLRAGEVREDDDTYQSPLDELFERLEMRDPNHIAVKYYKDYHSGSAKTLKSIQITLAARLEKFNLASVAALTATDELDLGSLGEKKVALFALIPDHDVSFNFLVSMVYSCTFEQLFRLADDKYKGALPVPVHFLMDEFANVSLPDDFDKLLATMRSRNVFVSIIIQNIAQLKNLFEKQWESILGNCDEFLYLGGNETGTHKMIAESYLGKETIDMNTYGKSSGRSGNYSTNWQITGRELLDAAEVRMLDNRYALLFIRGEMPVMDEKYDLLNHPNVKYTPEKGGAPYVHGGTELSVASMSVTSTAGRVTPTMSIFENDFELLSDEEIEAELFGGNKNESN